MEQGNTVGLIAPSGFVGSEKIGQSIRTLEQLGFNVIAGESCYLDRGYFARDDKFRADDIMRMFTDKTVGGIICVRGGHGAARLLDLLDFEVIGKNKKFFCGYSDITALNIAFIQRCGMTPFHTPMPATELIYCPDNFTMEYYRRCLLEKKPFGSISNPSGTPILRLSGGFCEGVLTGGNLSVLTSLIGTPYEIDVKDKVLFLEDIDEPLYKLDRMLLQLKLAGKFSDCCGIIFGAFTNCASEADGNLTFLHILEDLVLPEDKPVLYNLTCGHCMPTACLPLGETVSLDADEMKIWFK